MMVVSVTFCYHGDVYEIPTDNPAIISTAVSMLNMGANLDRFKLSTSEY